MQRTVRRASGPIALALLALGLFAAPANAGTPHVPVGTDPACPMDGQGDVIAADVTDPCWIEYVSVDGVWIPGLLIPPTDGTSGTDGHPLPGPRKFSNKGLIWAHGGFDRSAADGLAEYCGSSWSAAGGWNCGSGSSSCDECPRWERMFPLAGLGYWILAPDYRDSGSHGSAAVSQNAFDDIAGKDVDDVGLGADFLRDHVTVDSVILFGTSRGAWLTAGATYRYDEAVDGIAVISGGCDWISIYPYLSSGEKAAVDQDFGGPPSPPIPQAYYDRSACYHFAEMDKPILIMHGTTDASFPIEQARMFRDGLLGTSGHPPLEYREYEAGHTFFWGDSIPFGSGHWSHFNDWVESILGTNTVINSGPPPYTQTSTNEFTFSATGGAITFRCRIDGGSWVDPCTSPRGYTFPDGDTHTFEVAAWLSGGWDPTPATRTWTVDQTDPVTSITSGPASPTTASKVHFTLASNEPFPTYRCELDGVAIPACISNTEYAGITQGSHTFKAWASDAADNEDDTPAVYTWVMDTGPPRVTIDSGPSGTVTTTDAAFTFSANEPVTWTCNLDGGSYSACSSPQSYSGLAGGSHTFSVQATDEASNVTTKSRTWTVSTGGSDTTPPETTIDSGPEGTVTSSSATFTFSASEPATFKCRLDGATWAACSTPRDYTGLTNGNHTFEVRATDAAGNVDGSPASRSWTISAGGDVDPPETTIDSGPSGTTSSTSATFTFSADESGSTFQCRLDGGAWAGCATPKEYTGLAEGSHTFEVKATDAALNEDPTPASRTWTVSTGGPDTTPPETTIDSGPSGTVASSSATFTFSANEPATFKCKLDGTAWATCTPPREYTGLADGPHTFKVRATDTAGNVDGSAATRTWTVSAGGGDLSPPDTTITSGPPATTTEDDATFEFTSSETGSTFECRRRRSGTGYAACTSPHTIWDLPAGSYTVDVRATDAAGNTDPTPAAWSWQIVNAMAPWTQRL